MARKVAYWTSTALVSAALLMAVTYLSGSEQVVSGFAKAGYPQHLRLVLGIAKPVAALVLLLPGFALVKEWAYAGVTLPLTRALLSAHPSGEPVTTRILPLVLLVLLAVSYVTRPPNRRVIATFTL